MTARVVIHKLRERGCQSVRQRGSHQVWRCGDCQTVIPIHTGDLTPGVLGSIERDLVLCLGPRWLTK